MGWQEDLRAIDKEIERDYEKLVVRKYLPIFSDIVNDSSRVLSERNISSLQLGYAKRLSFTKFGAFMLDGDGEYIGLGVDELIDIARAYQNGDYKYSFQTALKMCLSDLVGSFREAIKNKQL